MTVPSLWMEIPGMFPQLWIRFRSMKIPGLLSWNFRSFRRRSGGTMEAFLTELAVGLGVPEAAEQ